MRFYQLEIKSHLYKWAHFCFVLALTLSPALSAGAGWNPAAEHWNEEQKSKAVLYTDHLIEQFKVNMLIAIKNSQRAIDCLEEAQAQRSSALCHEVMKLLERRTRAAINKYRIAEALHSSISLNPGLSNNQYLFTPTGESHFLEVAKSFMNLTPSEVEQVRKVWVDQRERVLQEYNEQVSQEFTSPPDRSAGPLGREARHILIFQGKVRELESQSRAAALSAYYALPWVQHLPQPTFREDEPKWSHAALITALKTSIEAGKSSLAKAEIAQAKKRLDTAAFDLPRLIERIYSGELERIDFALMPELVAQVLRKNPAHGAVSDALVATVLAKNQSRDVAVTYIGIPSLAMVVLAAAPELASAAAFKAMSAFFGGAVVASQSLRVASDARDVVNSSAIQSARSGLVEGSQAEDVLSGELVANKQLKTENSALNFIYSVRQISTNIALRASRTVGQPAAPPRKLSERREPIAAVGSPSMQLLPTRAASRWSTSGAQRSSPSVASIIAALEFHAAALVALIKNAVNSDSSARQENDLHTGRGSTSPIAAYGVDGKPTVDPLKAFADLVKQQSATATAQLPIQLPTGGDPLTPEGQAALESEPPPTLPSQTELIVRATKALAQWKDDSAPEGGMAKFFLDANFVDGSANDLTQYRRSLRALQGLIQTVKNIWDEDNGRTAEEKIEEIRVSFVRAHIHAYCSDYARMNDFFLVGCGNCEAQTHLILAVLRDAGVKVPTDQKWGVQLFSDHIQPVIFQGATQSIQNMVDGGVARRISAPVFHPASLYLAYLRGHGATQPIPGVTFQDLLIAAVPPPGIVQGKSSGVSSNTKSAFSKEFAAVAFGNGTPPKFALIDERRRSEGDSQRTFNASTTNPPGTTVGGVPLAKDNGKEFVYNVQPDLRWTSFQFYRDGGNHYQKTINFKNQSDYNEWFKATDRSSRVALIKRLANQDLTTYFATDGMRTLIKYLRDPSEINKLSPASLEQALKDYRFLTDIWYNYKKYLSHLFDMPLSGIPVVDELKSLLQSYRRLLAANPQVVIKAWNRLETVKIEKLFSLHREVYFYADNEMGKKPLTRDLEIELTATLVPIVHYLTDPKRAGVYRPKLGVQPGDTVLDFASDNGVITGGTLFTQGDDKGDPTAPDSGKGIDLTAPPETVVEPSVMWAVLNAGRVGYQLDGVGSSAQSASRNNLLSHSPTVRAREERWATPISAWLIKHAVNTFPTRRRHLMHLLNCEGTGGSLYRNLKSDAQSRLRRFPEDRYLENLAYQDKYTKPEQIDDYCLIPEIILKVLTEKLNDQDRKFLLMELDPQLPKAAVIPFSQDKPRFIPFPN